MGRHRAPVAHGGWGGHDQATTDLGYELRPRHRKPAFPAPMKWSFRCAGLLPAALALTALAQPGPAPAVPLPLSSPWVAAAPVQPPAHAQQAPRQPAVVEPLAPAPPVRGRAELPVTLPRPVSTPRAVLDYVVESRSLPQVERVIEPADDVHERRARVTKPKRDDKSENRDDEPRREHRRDRHRNDDQDRPRWHGRGDRDEHEGRRGREGREHSRGGGSSDRKQNEGRSERSHEGHGGRGEGRGDGDGRDGGKGDD